MTQQQARAALEGLELGSKKLSVKRPEEVIKMGLVSREQKLGDRVVASKVLFLKNIVSPDDLKSDAGYADICADIRLEAEKFGPVLSLEVPRSRGGHGGFGIPGFNAITAGGTFALEDSKAAALEDGTADSGSKTALAPIPIPKAVDGLALAVVNKAQLAIPGSGGSMSDGPTSTEYDPNAPGIGFAFIEFATIEGASRAKKALHGRRFGTNEVEAEYFSEDKYYAKDFANPAPNADEPKKEVGMELALVASADSENALEEAPVMVE